MNLRTLRSTCALLISVCGLTVAAAGRADGQTITLAWDPSSGSVGYRVHAGIQSGTYSQHFDVGSATMFTFQNATAGQRYCFAVSAYLLSSLVEGPNSAEICGYSNAPPTLQNPGNVTSTVGQPVSLQLVGSDPESQPLTYSATGLPPGLAVQASTGFISGTGTTAGTYNVTARASDGTLTASQQFTWLMSTATGGGDTTRPTATITSPTTNATYTATTGTINVGGTASDNVGVTQVRWSNDRGGNGTATGTTNWSVSGVPLQTGTNIITITASDAVGNTGTDTLTVSWAGSGTSGPDTTRPTVTIMTPTTGSLYLASSSTINLTGTAADNVGVVRVQWMNSRGGEGVASGTTSWSVGGIRLQTGDNILYVRAQDAAGNQSLVDTLTVTYSTTTTTPPPTEPPPPTSTTGTLQLENIGNLTARLRWTNTGSWGTSVDIYRNGVRMRATSNDGGTTDQVPARGTYSYRLCAPNSTTTCTNTASVTF